MKQRYFIHLSYKGTAYHGWQIQPNGISVQELLMKAFSTILRYPIDIAGAGRTDAGVHAKLMVAHIDLNEALEDVAAFIFKLNGLLPNDISVQKMLTVKANAHARFDAYSRTYDYFLISKKNPFLQDLAARVYNYLDFESMNKVAKCLLEYTDFTSFSKSNTAVKTNNCTVTQAQWVKHDDVWVFTIQANRFLRNMVRAIVGTLLQVGRGQMTEEEFRAVIEAKDRTKAGTSAPAEGLYLVNIDYPSELFL